MSVVKYTAIIDCDAGKVWSVLKKFGGISEWHPAILNSEIENSQSDSSVNCIRKLILEDGSALRERLLSLNEPEKTFSYTFEEASLPLENYIATIKVIPLTEEQRSVIQWIATFDSPQTEPKEKYIEIINNLIVSGHKNLQAFFNR